MQIKCIVVGLLHTNCYLFISEGDMLVVDPGDAGERIVEEIKQTGAKVKYIVITHWHPDHISALEKVAKETGAEVLKDLQEGDKIEVGSSVLTVLHTPGHTEDSICLLGDGILFSGDTLFYRGYGRTDLPGGSEEKMEKTLQRLSDEIPPGTVVYPGHGRSFER